MMVWSENIRYLRGKVGLSQRQLAEELGMTRARYSKYEYGVAEPPIEVLVKLAKYFGVTVDHLLEQDLAMVTKEKH